MNTESKKPGGRPMLASYQKRTRCFRVMFNENDYNLYSVKGGASRTVCQ